MVVPPFHKLDDRVFRHPERKPESIRWDDVVRIWLVMTSNGPWTPDQWLLFESQSGGCSMPTEADGFDQIWEMLKDRFPGFDYTRVIEAGTVDARYLCWARKE
jgi:hypothetical protein